MRVGRVVDDDFGDGAAESAAYRVFFDRQDGATGGGSLDRRGRRAAGRWTC